MMTMQGAWPLQRFLLPIAMSLVLQANGPAEIEKRVDALLGPMTLREELVDFASGTACRRRNGVQTTEVQN